MHLNNTFEKWEEKTLDEVCSFSRGLTYSKNDEVEFSDNVVLRANNIDLVSNSLNFDELKYITSTFAIPEDKKVKENSIMICISSGSKSHLGKVAFIDRDYGYAFGGFMGLMTPKENINPKYLYYMLITPSFKDLILHLTDGANINNLKYNDLKNFKLNIPPLPDQQRIVAKLDEAFEAIDKVKANAEQNLTNAKELFESALNDAFTKNTEGWEEKTLGSISELKQNKAEVKNIDANTLVSFVPMEYLGINQKYFNSNQSKPIKNLIKSYTYFAENDVIMAKITPCFENGKIGIANALMNKIGFGSSEYIVFRPNKDINNEYLYYFLNREAFRKEGAQNMLGAVGHKRVSKEFIENYPFSYPSPSEQQKIVEKLDALQEQTKRLEQIYMQKIKECDELKQSILQKAFRGEL